MTFERATMKRVILGLDPGISVVGGPRIKSGDDLAKGTI